MRTFLTRKNFINSLPFLNDNMYTLATELEGFAVGEKFEKTGETPGFIILKRLSRKESIVSINRDIFAECFTEDVA